VVAKHPRDMHGLRRADQATACLLAEVAALARPEITTAALDAHASSTIQRLGAEPHGRWLEVSDELASQIIGGVVPPRDYLHRLVSGRQVVRLLKDTDRGL